MTVSYNQLFNLYSYNTIISIKYIISINIIYSIRYRV